MQVDPPGTTAPESQMGFGSATFARNEPPVRPEAEPILVLLDDESEPARRMPSGTFLEGLCRILVILFALRSQLPFPSLMCRSGAPHWS